MHGRGRSRGLEKKKDTLAPPSGNGELLEIQKSLWDFLVSCGIFLFSCGIFLVSTFLNIS